MVGIGEKKESGLLNVRILNQFIISFSRFCKGKDGLEVFDKFEAFHCLPDADTYYFTILLLHVFKGWGNGETCGDDEFKGKYGLQTTCVHLHCSC